jgi:hypothetical protein
MREMPHPSMCRSNCHVPPGTRSFENAVLASGVAAGRSCSCTSEASTTAANSVAIDKPTGGSCLQNIVRFRLDLSEKIALDAAL